MKKVKVEFFRATFTHSAETFQGFLKTAATLPATKRLTRLNSEILLLITEIHHASADFWSGEIHRIRTRGFPDRIDLKTLREEDLGLLTQQGLVERIHFAYRSSLDALALQVSRDFRPGTFRTYIEEVSSLPFELALILRKGAYAKLLGFRTISKMNVRVANPPSGAEFTGLDAPGVGEIVDLMRDFGAATVEIKVQRAKDRRASLIFKPILDCVDNLLRVQTMDSVAALSVTGKREEDENLEPVDFIRDRLVYSGGVEFDSKGRLDSSQCRKLVMDGLIECDKMLQRG